MKIFQQIRKLFGAILLAVIIGLSGTHFVYAEEADDEIPDYRLQLSPARQDVGDLQPGSVYTNTLKVQNTGENLFKYKVSVSPFSVKDEKYTQDHEDVTKYNSIINWITFSKTTGTLEPNTQDEISYTIRIPSDVPAGGQYAILMAEIINEEDETQSSGISAIRRVGMLLYANVHGNTRLTGDITENKISGILFNPPISATSIVENTGNTHTEAKYVLQVYPLFGNEEVYTNEEDPTVLTILPETRRLNTVTWPGSPHLGIFRVKQTVTFLDKNSTTEKIVFLCPIWFLLIILILIFCIIFWIISRIRTRNKK